MQNSSGIEGKVVVITDASTGIGEATALLLAERGAKVVLGARGIGSTSGFGSSPPRWGGDAISEGLRQEAGDKLRVTIISPGFVRTNFAESVTNPEVKAKLAESRDKFAMPPDAIARAIAFAIEQPADVDVNEIIVRPTARSNSASEERSRPYESSFTFGSIGI
jgi:NADP-dependent 3-hydroxy acid dehydrogenase YdfG